MTIDDDDEAYALYVAAVFYVESGCPGLDDQLRAQALRAALDRVMDKLEEQIA